MGTNRYGFSKRWNGFTLIELLVVISIIAMLLSILTSSLQNARAQAQKVVCQSNLKQQAMACFLYMENSNDVFPSKADCVQSYYSWGGKNGLPPWTDFKDRLLNPYIGRLKNVTNTEKEASLKVFCCPSDRGIPSWAMGWFGRIDTTWNLAGSSYLYNSAAINNDGTLGLWQKNRLQVKRANKCILAGDFGIATYWGAVNPPYTPYVRAYWHNRKEFGWNNVLFVDGHVDFIKMTPDKPDFQNGDNWTVRFDGPKY
jgi:prepilin-type N-terminal cleavage/methylation domain-containing protein/prepilin-type processing-associated H-X9-DG protein